MLVKADNFKESEIIMELLEPRVEIVLPQITVVFGKYRDIFLIRVAGNFVHGEFVFGED